MHDIIVYIITNHKIVDNQATFTWNWVGIWTSELMAV